jgi:hypothetical protein
MTKLTTIISGGQTGADRAGLEVARELGLLTGGTAPDRYLTENGCDPSLAEFGLIAHEGLDYDGRTRLNVRNSNGTVIFGNVESGGTALTVLECTKAGKPYIVNPSARELRCWLLDHAIVVLNVAGNRASDNPGLADIVKATIRGALREPR